jgi:hypothetical protein
MRHENTEHPTRLKNISPSCSQRIKGKSEWQRCAIPRWAAAPSRSCHRDAATSCLHRASPSARRRPGPKFPGKGRPSNWTPIRRRTAHGRHHIRPATPRVSNVPHCSSARLPRLLCDPVSPPRSHDPSTPRRLGPSWCACRVVSLSGRQARAETNALGSGCSAQSAERTCEYPVRRPRSCSASSEASPISPMRRSTPATAPWK